MDVCQKKISLTDYVSARGGTKSSGTSTPQPFNFSSYPNSIGSNDNAANTEAIEETLTIKIG